MQNIDRMNLMNRGALRCRSTLETSITGKSIENSSISKLTLYPSPESVIST